MKIIIMGITLNYFISSEYMKQPEIMHLLARAKQKTTKNGLQYFILNSNHD